MQFRPGSVVVFEGLDRTGKTTQLQRLRDLNWADPSPVLAHMPSGFTKVTADIYALTETVSMTSPLGRQLLHLACHAENMTALQKGRDDGGLILDRWWWSTVAYGWFGGGLSAVMEEATFRGMVDAVWSGLQADVVFVFDTPLEQDRWNVDGVKEGYLSLAAENPDVAVMVPPSDVDSTADFIMSTLRGRGVLLASA